MFNGVSGIAIRYRFNLPKDDFASRAPKPGERLPFLRFNSGGKSLILHELLSPLTYTLLVFGVLQIPSNVQNFVDEYSEIINVKHIPAEDGSQHLFKALGIKKEACYLVRPDMYIAWRGQGFEDEELRYFLQKTLN
jgi:hypothetical protein